MLDTADRIFGNPDKRLAGKMVETIRGAANGAIVLLLATDASSSFHPIIWVLSPANRVGKLRLLLDVPATEPFAASQVLSPKELHKTLVTSLHRGIRSALCRLAHCRSGRRD
jgi:hypothetical protein